MRLIFWLTQTRDVQACVKILHLLCATRRDARDAVLGGDGRGRGASFSQDREVSLFTGKYTCTSACAACEQRPSFAQASSCWRLPHRGPRQSKTFGERERERDGGGGGGCSLSLYQLVPRLGGFGDGKILGCAKE